MATIPAARLKDIPALARDNSNLSAVMDAIREAMQTFRGYRGDPLDQALTLRDALDKGVLLNSALNGYGRGPLVGPGSPDWPVTSLEADLTPPPMPEGLTASAGITYIYINCDVPVYTQGHGHDRTVVYGAKWPTSDAAPTFSSAVELFTFQGTVGAYPSEPATRWCIWIKWKSNDGVLSVSPAGGTNGVSTTTGQDVSLLLTALTSQITRSQLHSDLGTPIDLINAPTTGLVDRMNAANASIITINATLADITSTPVYDPATPYAADFIVSYSGGLYQAKSSTTGNLPTNTTYWTKIGDYASIGDAVAGHAVILSDHDTRITNNAGDITAVAGRATVLEAAVNSATTGLATKASVSYVDTAKSDAISASATASQTLVSSIKVGGANLMPNSGQFTDISGWSSSGSTLSLDATVLYGAYSTFKLLNSGGSSNNLIMRLKPDTEYTVSAMVKGSAALSGSQNTHLHIQNWRTEDITNAHQETSLAYDQDITTSWKRVWQTFRTVASTDLTYCIFYIYPLSTGFSLNVGYVKLEEGNRATDWAAPSSELTAAIQVEATTRASQTGDLFAQYTVKLDVGGKVSGYGLASTSTASEFAIRSDRFYIAPPSGTTGISDIIPFIVQTSPTTINGVVIPAGVYMDAAYIVNLTAMLARLGSAWIDNAMIANLNAAQLTAGDGSIGGNLKSITFTSDSVGWLLQPNGNSEFNNTVVRGTVYASAGNIGGNTIDSTGMQSPGYSAGVSGWRLGSDGNLHGNNGTFKGDITGATGTFSGALSAATGTFAGSLSAAIGTFAGSLTAATGTLGALTIASGGYIQNGQTGYNTGVGFWFGSSAGTPKFSIGNPSGPRMLWDGTDLNINTPTFDTFSATIPSGNLTASLNYGLNVVVGSRSVSVTGGKTPYSYVWDTISTSATHYSYRNLDVSSGVTSATAQVSANGDNSSTYGVLRCIVTDANGRTTAATVSLSATFNSSGGGGA